jgi:hypothetical protein
MNKEVWDRVAEAANGKAAICEADLALALVDLRVALDTLKDSYSRCQDSLHHIDKQLAKVSSACHVTYSRVTGELLGGVHVSFCKFRPEL